MSINCSLQNKVIRVNLENESLKDEISDLKKVIKKWTCSKVTLDQLLSDQIPGNIVKALGGKGKRKENNSKKVLFTKDDVSTSKSALMITSDYGDDSDNRKKTELKHLVVQNSCFDKNALPSTEQLLLTLMEEVKGCGICGSIDHEIADCLKNLRNSRKKRLLSSNQNPLKSEFTKGTDMCENVCAGLPKEESGPKVVFGDNYLGDTEGYGLANCNGITFTK
nr:retrovirus-related Pol polyprotein from transposon TNT 1-94 [Tanacetum cinerariifolium]